MHASKYTLYKDLYLEIHTTLKEVILYSVEKSICLYDISCMLKHDVQVISNEPFLKSPAGEGSGGRRSQARVAAATLTNNINSLTCAFVASPARHSCAKCFLWHAPYTSPFYYGPKTFHLGWKSLLIRFIPFALINHLKWTLKLNSFKHILLFNKLNRFY